MACTEDKELSRLTEALKRSLEHTRADSTARKYGCAFDRWHSWARERSGVKPFPVEPEHLCLYLQHIKEATGSKAAVIEAVSAVAWAHQLAGVASVSDHPLVKATVAAMRRALAKPVNRKEPVSASMLQRLVEEMGQDPALSDLRTTSACLLAFAGFLRFDELIRLQCKDLVFSPDRLTVMIRSSKTDQYRRGNEVLIARSKLATCPVAMMERYARKADLDLQSDKLVFRGISKSRSGEKLRSSGGISYTRMREVILQRFGQLGYDTSSLGLHSFRAGGATAAANLDVPDRLFKRHGRWRSEAAKDGYVKDSDKAMLQVSKGLGI